MSLQPAIYSSALSERQVVGFSAISQAGTIDPTEALLSQIWKRNFGPRGLDGNSHLLRSSFGVLRLMKFLREVEAELGYKLPPSKVLRLGTVKAVAASIQSGIWPPTSPAVLIRNGRKDATVYLVSMGDGVFLNLCDLAAQIDFAGQIWGLQLPGLDGEVEPLTSIPDMAQHYVDAMMKQATATTYQMVGHSFGGLVTLR